jgi:hypothetical protein
MTYRISGDEDRLGGLPHRRQPVGGDRAYRAGSASGHPVSCLATSALGRSRDVLPVTSRSAPSSPATVTITRRVTGDEDRVRARDHATRRASSSTGWSEGRQAVE